MSAPNMVAAAIAAASAPVVNLHGHSIVEANFEDAEASIIFNTDGTVDQRKVVGGTTQIDASTDWIIPNGAASGDYEVRVTVLSGDDPTGTSIDNWHSLGTIRTFSQIQSGVGSKTCNLRIEIRDISDTVVATNDSYTLTADGT